MYVDDQTKSLVGQQGDGGDKDQEASLVCMVSATCYMQRYRVRTTSVVRLGLDLDDFGVRIRCRLFDLIGLSYSKCAKINAHSHTQGVLAAPKCTPVPKGQDPKKNCKKRTHASGGEQQTQESKVPAISEDHDSV